MVFIMSQTRVHLKITGYVQGVFYRATTRETALRLGLKGWVRNRSDGSVEAVAEGDDASVDNFMKWCRKGPPGATVHDMEVRREEYTGEFTGFQIRY